MKCSSRYVHRGGVLLSAMSLALLSACATNPATGQSQLVLVSESQAIQMGRQASQQVRETLGLVDDPGLQRYVQSLGHRLAQASERPDLPWEFHVVDDPAPNAFALPGGFIYITRGMMSLMMSEAELASVLGHEIAHVTARHAVNQMSKQQLAQAGVGLAGLIFPEVRQLTPLIGAGLNLLFLKYSRDDEREADSLGFEYVRKQGYDVSQFADVFATLQRAGDSGGGALPGWLSTHPTPEERVQTARVRAQKLGEAGDGRVGREPYLRHIDGLVYGQNPRHGFFRDNVFYHPVLRIGMRLPEGWQRQNMAQAVIAAAPQGAAAFEMTLVPGPGPDEALSRFTRQQGVRTAQPSRETLNGLPAYTVEFEAQTQQGPVRGVAAFVEHRERTYQLVGYAAAGAFAQFRPELVATIASFGPVTDPDILAIDPRRIDIVELQQALTLQEFARRFASTVPVEELAVLNHLPGSEARLSSGTLVKRVVS